MVNILDENGRNMGSQQLKSEEEICTEETPFTATRYAHFDGLTLESGERVGPLTIAYET